jgi:MFS family permease
MVVNTNRGMMVSETTNQINDNVMRFFAIVAAGILLNLGLFFMVIFAAPFIVGIMSTYILGDRRNGIIAAFVSSLLAYSLMFIVTGFATDIPVFIAAVLIMCSIAIVGGIVGAFIHKKATESSSQVSTTIRPGE